MHENTIPISLRCIQANLRHSRMASLNLSKLVVDMLIDIVLIQEPYAKLRNNSLDLPYFNSNYQIFHRLNNTDFYYGSVILVRNGLQAQITPEISQNHLIGVEIKTSFKTYHFLSVYCRPSKELFDSIKYLNALSDSFL